MALAARMNAATYPDADHSAATMLTIARMPAVFCPPFRMFCTASRRICRAAPGANCSMLPVTVFTAEVPASPTTVTRTSRPGNSDRIA